ncbi:MAG: hypothetical protein LBS29_04300 [Endomicrobium sp.]|jgi:hypothetical protein|nr:hypothetical protein [Endomicrobium sp.]
MSIAINFIDVDYTNKEHIQMFKKCYKQVFYGTLKNTDLLDNYDNLLIRLKNKSLGDFEKDNLHFLLCTVDGIPISGIIFNYIEEINSAVIECIAVKEEEQCLGWGTLLFSEAIYLMKADALRAGHRQLSWIFSELVGKVSFWHKQGFKLAGGFNSIITEGLNIYPHSVIVYSPANMFRISAKTLIIYIKNYMFLCFKVKKVCSGNDTVKLVSLK